MLANLTLFIQRRNTLILLENIVIIQTLNFKALAVERFYRNLANDKTHIQRLPEEDMCQATSLLASRGRKFSTQLRLSIQVE